MTPETYLDLKRAIIDLGYAHEVDWAMDVKPPKCGVGFWYEYAWVVLNSGMKNQIAEKIWNKVRPAVESGKSASTVFGHKGKAAAIDYVWQNKQALFDSFLNANTPDDQVEFCAELPWIGEITKYHLAKNLGVNCAKPDRHLARIAGTEGTHALCERISKITGDRIAAVDLVIWRAANLGLV